LAAHPDDIEAALTAYEQAMFPRSIEAAAEGSGLYEFMFGDDAPHSLVAAFAEHDEGQGQDPGQNRGRSQDQDQ
ncbi:FAD-dependent oxidoreductase, partial [Streptomyces sp. NRRL WC-3753]